MESLSPCNKLRQSSLLFQEFFRFVTSGTLSVPKHMSDHTHTHKSPYSIGYYYEHPTVY